MPDQIHLEWRYEPADLFEERTEFLIDGCRFVVDAGTVSGLASFEGNPATDLRKFCNSLHQRLDALFIAAEMFEHKPYTLQPPHKTVRVSPDGRKDVNVFPQFAVINIAGGQVDVLIQDQAGNIEVDTRGDRIAKRNELAQSAAELIDDAVANSILRSYAAAVRDSGNELIHLYEVRDAVAAYFGSEAAALKAIPNISATDWATLGRLANGEPILQGRHRGEHLGVLRQATAEELFKARAIARAMVEGFLVHLKTVRRTGT
jgi:hypothetical protein